MTSSDKLARLAGLLYLILIATGFFSLKFVPGRVEVSGDSAATLAHIQAHQTLFGLGIVAGVAGFIDFLLLGLVLHRLFSPVGKGGADLMLALVAVSTPISLVAWARRVDVLSLLHGERGLPKLGPDQLPTQVMLALDGYDNTMMVSLIFWGLWLFPLGWLVWRSRFAPRVLGVLLILGGFGYVFDFAGGLLDPNYGHTLFARLARYLFGIPGAAGEFGTCLWLLIMGARGPKAKPSGPAVRATSSVASSSGASITSPP